jgi:putative hydrolase of the HAD superfamily
MPIKAVFFDAGGTLIHPHPSVGEVYGGVAERLGCFADPRAIEARFHEVWSDYQRRARVEGLPLPRSDEEDREMWIRLTRSLCDGVPALRDLDFKRWFDGIHAAFTVGGCWQVYPEVRDVIREVRQRGLGCGVVSNWGSYLLDILRDHNLESPMDFIQVSALEGSLKPDAVFYRKALDRAGVSAAEALHVGDTYRDDAAGAMASGLLGVHLDRDGRGAPGNGVPVVRDLRGILALL